MDLMEVRRSLLQVVHAPGIVNLCPAATGMQLREYPIVSNSRQIVITGLNPDNDYTFQATWIVAWETDSGKRIYASGESTRMIRPQTGDVAPMTKYVTLKPTANGDITINANASTLNEDEYAGSIVNMQLEVGSVPHPYVPYIGN